MPKITLNESKFDKIIKERGLEYYNEEMVGELYNFNSDIHAKVNGYTVIIGPKCNYCSCPYDGYYCKHLYALLLKIKHDGVPDDLMDELNKMNKKQLLQLLKKIVDRCALKSMIILKIINDPNNDNLSNTSESDDY